MPRENGPASASLVYRFESSFPLDRVEIMLDAAAPASPGTRNVLSLTTDETAKSWPLEVVQQNSNGIATARLEDKKVVQGKHVFFVRILMENPDGQAGIAANRLDHLRVRCVHQPPQPGASAQLVADDNDVLSYEDDFQATRWTHFGEVAAADPSHGGFRDGHFWVGLKGGTGTSTRLVQRISSPRPLKELTVIADCNADAPNLGGSVTLSIAPRQGQPCWSVTSQGRHDGPLSLTIPSEELRELRDFDLHILLSSSSGVEQGDKACAVLRRIQVQAK